MKYTMQSCVSDWSYTSGKAYRDPFNDVELDVLVTDPEGQELIVPASWTGEQTWGCATPHTSWVGIITAPAAPTWPTPTSTVSGAPPKSPLTRAPTPFCRSGRCAWPLTTITWSTPTARPSSDWAIPGGWA